MLSIQMDPHHGIRTMYPRSNQSTNFFISPGATEANGASNPVVTTGSTFNVQWITNLPMIDLALYQQLKSAPECGSCLQGPCIIKTGLKAQSFSWTVDTCSMSLLSSNVFYLMAHDSSKDWGEVEDGFISPFMRLAESNSNQTITASNSSATLSLSPISAPTTFSSKTSTTSKSSTASTSSTSIISTSGRIAIISTSQSVIRTTTSEISATIILSSTLSTPKPSTSASSSQTPSQIPASSSQSMPTAESIPREITITLAVVLSIVFSSIALCIYIIYRHKKRRRYNREVSWNSFLSRVRDVSKGNNNSNRKTTDSLDLNTLPPVPRNHRWTGFNRTRKKKSMYELDGTSKVSLFELP